MALDDHRNGGVLGASVPKPTPDAKALKHLLQREPLPGAQPQTKLRIELVSLGCIKRAYVFASVSSRLVVQEGPDWPWSTCNRSLDDQMLASGERATWSVSKNSVYPGKSRVSSSQP
jgi:hypothetical protein